MHLFHSAPSPMYVSVKIASIRIQRDRAFSHKPPFDLLFPDTGHTHLTHSNLLHTNVYTAFIMNLKEEIASLELHWLFFKLLIFF